MKCDECKNRAINNLCNSCLDRERTLWEEKGKEEGKKEGGVAELEKLIIEIESDRKENIVWREGSQYFENILNKIEKRLAELKEARK